jgi:DNA-binding GntR family transcriptional regulator
MKDKFSLLESTGLMAQTPFSLDTDGNRKQRFKLERTYLKDQVTDLLRDYLIGGRIAPGTKLVERDVAEQLGVSRAPARDALMQLEKEGLVISRPNGRYVIEPTGQDVKELYQVRLVLEKLAIELTMQQRTAEDCAELAEKLAEMNEAVTRHDRLAFARTDVELHDLIWQQSGNRHLRETLSTMSGAIFLFAANNADYYDWDEAYQLHEDLVRDINSGDARAAAKSLERHVEKTIQRLLGLYH